MVRKILSIAWNDVRIEFSYRSTLVFFLVLPLVFTMVIGVGLQNGGGSSDGDPRFPVLVVNEDGSLVSEALAESLEASQVIRPVFRDLDEADRLLEEAGNVSALLTIPEGFGESVLAGQPAALVLRKEAGDTSTLAVEQALASIANQVGSAVAAARISAAEAESIRPFESDAARQAYFEEGLALALEGLKDPPARVEVTQAPEVTVEIATGFEQSSPGQLVTWVLITLIGAAEVFVNERLGGTLRRLLSTPTGKGAILGGKVLGRLGMGLVQMVLLIGFGAFVFGVNWGRSPAALALVVLAFALAAVALGVLLGTFAKTRGQASGLTILFSMLMAALGGAWWPLEITPPIYQKAVTVLPTTWAMTGFNDVILRGQGVSAVLPEVGILLGFAVLFFTAGIWRFKFE